MPSQPENASGQGSSDRADADLRRLIEIVVRDFNGDTSAFFESLQPVQRPKDADTELESKIARRFAKSL